MARKIDKYVIVPEHVDPERPVPYHETSTRIDRELGPGLSYASNNLVPGADMRIGVRKIKQVPPNYVSHLAPHKHEVSEVYGVIGDLTVEFILDGETREVTGPASMFIPAGMMHTYRPVRGSGYFMIVYRGGDYQAFGDD